jgi:hypothetical protein
LIDIKGRDPDRVMLLDLGSRARQLCRDRALLIHIKDFVSI